VNLDEIRWEIEELESSGCFGAKLAAELESRAERLAVGETGRAEYLVEAGEHWSLAGDAPRAVGCFEQAVTDGGPTVLSAKSWLMAGLLESGDIERADHLQSELLDGFRSGDSSVDPEFIADQLEHHGRLREALRWFNLGVRRIEDAPVGDLGLAGLTALNGRSRVRRALGLAPDSTDAGTSALRDEFLAGVEAAGAPEAPEAMLFWPGEQRAELVRLLPHLKEFGATVEEHRARAEQVMRSHESTGRRFRIVYGDVSQYLAFARLHGLDPAEQPTRHTYTNELLRSTQPTPWPPARNQPCWCRSGLKYKRCCGGLRFPTPSAPLVNG
jgi:hypothetical protein